MMLSHKLGSRNGQLIDTSLLDKIVKGRSTSQSRSQANLHAPRWQIVRQRRVFYDLQQSRLSAFDFNSRELHQLSETPPIDLVGSRSKAATLVCEGSTLASTGGAYQAALPLNKWRQTPTKVTLSVFRYMSFYYLFSRSFQFHRLEPDCLS